MTDNSETKIKYNGGALGMYEYWADINDTKETIVTSIPPTPENLVTIKELFKEIADKKQ